MVLCSIIVHFRTCSYALLQMASRTYPRHDDIRCKTNRCPIIVKHLENMWYTQPMVLGQSHEQSNANVIASGNQ